MDALSNIVDREFCLPPALRHMCFGIFSYVDVFLTVLKHAKELKNEETARFCETAILEIWNVQRLRYRDTKDIRKLRNVDSVIKTLRRKIEKMID